MISLPHIDIAKYKAKLILAGGVVLFWLASIIGAYFYGKAVNDAEQKASVVKVLEKEVKDGQKEAKKNAEMAERVGREFAEREARLNRAEEKANEAIEANPRRSDGSCDLTDDELRSLQELGDSY